MPREDEDKQSLSPLILDDSLSSSSHLDSPRFSPVRFTSRRRRLVVTAVAVFSVFSLLFLAYLSSSRPHIVSQDPAPAPSLDPSLDHTPSSNRKAALLGPPTSRFRGSPSGFLLHLSSVVTSFVFIQTTFVATQSTSHLGFLPDGVSVPPSVLSSSHN